MSQCGALAYAILCDLCNEPVAIIYYCIAHIISASEAINILVPMLVTQSLMDSIHILFTGEIYSFIIVLLFCTANNFYL